MAVEITLIRHGETEANAAGVWQGTSDSRLTRAGRAQVEHLGERYRPSPFDLVLASHLGRAHETAGALGRVETDVRWRELDLGSWEGKTVAEIEATDPAALAALGSGEDVAFGGGERVSEMVERLEDALSHLATRLDSGERAAVVSHGGALLTLMSHMLGVDTRGKLLRLTNTSVSKVRVEGGVPAQLSVFNDSTHLPGAPVRAEQGATHVVLARHGETLANVEGRWQGQSQGELTANGQDQARKLGARFPEVKAMFSSPLRRAADTAGLIAQSTGVTSRPVTDLQELGFGKWEMMTVDEIAVLDPDRLREVGSGLDVVRGETGETFGGLRDRVTAAVSRLAGRYPGETIGVVSHGAATRALATGILGLTFAERRRIGLLDNAAIARVVFGTRGPALAAWNLTAHLES